MATIQTFIRTGKGAKKNHVNIRFRLSDGRDIQLFHKSELVINADKWDVKKQSIKASCVYDAKKRNEFNKALTDRKNLILDIYTQNLGKKVDFTSDWLNAEIDRALHLKKGVKSENITLFRFIDKFIQEAPNRNDNGRVICNGTIKQYKVFYEHIKEFAKISLRDDFEFSEIDLKFYSDYVVFLQGKNYTSNNVGKNIKTLKTILNAAAFEGCHINPALSKFKVFKEDIDNISLNEDDLQKLKELDLSKYPHLDKVRDLFLLLAWTGCRFSDLGKIAKTDIKDGFITFRQQKTNNKVVIPLHPVVLEVLEKYNYDLPEQISNQKFNAYIKEAARMAGINSRETMTRTEGGKLVTTHFEKWEQVSSHTGRRSFCTNMYRRGLPALMIMSISGHKTENSFLKYIKVKQNEHAEMMKKAWENIYK
ncbi:MAG: site-specific integrase [Dysgonamonadaceae bacterium]|jgi:integrase|nr:site-specific integrase [Dysgonamonadaceae bacterium]